jgi:hypothetical protein
VIHSSRLVTALKDQAFVNVSHNSRHQIVTVVVSVISDSPIVVPANVTLMVHVVSNARHQVDSVHVKLTMLVRSVTNVLTDTTSSPNVWIVAVTLLELYRIHVTCTPVTARAAITSLVDPVTIVKMVTLITLSVRTVTVTLEEQSREYAIRTTDVVSARKVTEEHVVISA